LRAGMVNPRDLPAHAVRAATDEVEDEDDHLALVTRWAQLVSLLRTSLSHTRFTSLATDIVANTSVVGAVAWHRAKAGALAGELTTVKFRATLHGTLQSKKQWHFR
jgi:hypothetical protein